MVEESRCITRSIDVWLDGQPDEHTLYFSQPFSASEKQARDQASINGRRKRHPMMEFSNNV